MASVRSKNNWTNWHHKFHKQFINDKTFIPKGAKLLISVSGGQDSMALMTLINDIKDQHDWEINIWHGDHQWHKDSTLYANKLRHYCNKEGIPSYFDTANEKEITSEESARNWRYQKLIKTLEKLLSEENAIRNWYILTGHTSTDNTETFILNLARGSNYAGLAGIPKKRLLNDKYSLVRPILIFNRNETSAICQGMNIPFWEDPTNLDLSIKRNFIRQELLPHLENIYPGCTKRINQFIGKMNNYSIEQADLSKLALKACRSNTGIKREVLNTLGLEARCTIIYTLIKEKSLKQISAKNLETISIQILEKNNGQINLNDELKIIWNKYIIRLEI
tara:strand:+ start:564 stop:1568 length:1005 start_codon:yes stop_codon:yes gene_type:complete